MPARRHTTASLLLTGLLLAPSPATAADPGPCRTAIAAAERAAFVPDRLMQAIGIVESGRRDPAGTVAPWPWTINVEGVGEVFDTKQQAIAAVTAHRARGARSIDVGCMQVNLMHHAEAFPSLEDAFDPATNARYAARFLQRLLDQTGSWPRAVAGYHSLTPDIGEAYARKVMAIWARPEPARQPPPSTQASTQAPNQTLPPPALPGAASARIFPLPGAGAITQTGRGLDAYRAMPTRLVTATLFKRQ